MIQGRLVCRVLAIPLLLVTTTTYVSTMNAQTRLSAAMSTSVISPATVGSIVTWNGTATGSVSGNVWYRFRVREVGPISDHCRPRGLPFVPACVSSSFSIIQDYGPGNTVGWTASDHEEINDMEFSATDNTPGAVSHTTSVFQFLPRVSGGTPVINPTANPLVFLYSVPPCPANSTMSV